MLIRSGIKDISNKVHHIVVHNVLGITFVKEGYFYRDTPTN